MIRNQMLFCYICDNWVARVAPPIDGGDVYQSHLDTCHRIYHCLLCREATAFEGRDAVLKHLLEFHCVRLCHFHRCNYRPGTADADERHMAEKHAQYQKFKSELQSIQEQGSTTVQGEFSEPVDKADDQDDSDQDESDIEYEGASGIAVQETGDDPHCESAGMLVMENSCLIWKQNPNASGSR